MSSYDLEEQEQLAELKAFWKQYGNLILLGVALALAVFAAYLFWNRYQGWQSAQASAIYGELQKAAAANDPKKVRDLSGALIENHPRTVYAALGALVSAQTHFNAGELKTARAQLQWAVDNARDREVQAIARLRLANVLLDEKAYAEALNALAVTPEPAFAALFEELRGDILAAQGKSAEARAAYKEALAKARADAAADRELIQLKLDSLGGG
jgi:predicted negative regulator of RcsB-dependent stress response